MATYNWTLIKTTEPQGNLHAQFPNAGHNNSDNFFFVDSDNATVDPIIIRDLITLEEGDDFWQVFITYTLEELMFLNRDKHIQLSKDEARHLHAYDGWRIWMNAIGEYDDETGDFIEDPVALEAAWIETQVWFPALQTWNPNIPHTARKQQLESVWKRA